MVPDDTFYSNSVAGLREPTSTGKREGREGEGEGRKEDDPHPSKIPGYAPNCDKIKSSQP